MAFPTTIERILSLGGSVTIDLKKGTYFPQTLERFAAIASNSGAKLVIQGADTLFPDTLYKIAAFGRGSVVFEFDK